MDHSLSSAELDALTQTMADNADKACAAGQWRECHAWQAAIALIESARRESFTRRIRRREQRSGLATHA